MIFSICSGSGLSAPKLSPEYSRHDQAFFREKADRATRALAAPLSFPHQHQKHLGFYPSTAALSITLLGLQTIAQPDLIHALEQRQTEAAEDDDEGDPDDPAAQLKRRLKRIRNGEPIDTLKVPLCKTQLGAVVLS